MLKPIDLALDSNDYGIDSRVTGSTDYPNFTFQPSLTDIVGYSILSANIPFTYFIIDNTCNTFLINATTVTVEPGTYNAINLVNQLNLRTTAAGLVGYTWFVDNTTSKLTVYNTTGSFTLTMSSSSPTQPFGFTTGTFNSQTSPALYDNTETVIASANYIQSPKAVNLSGPNFMFLHSSLSGAAQGTVRNQTNSSDLIAFWPVNANYQGMIEYVNPNPEMVPLTKSDIVQLNFYLTVGNKTSYSLYSSSGTATTVNYLPLNGEGIQVTIRFYQLDNTNQYVASQPRSAQPTSINQGQRGPQRRHIFG